jgi:predicted TIM-barrel fold metal-dependent hydrolase
MNALDYFHLAGLPPGVPTIRRHTDEQLETAIERAARHPDFYVLLHGVDAYMERRRRRARAARMARYYIARAEALNEDFQMWGQS